MTDTPYKTAAFKYLTHGWKGPIPVGTQPHQKTHPPTGYTGTDGAWPTEDQIAEWVQARPHVNIALRLPEHVIGVDVDTYGNKPGADTMIAVTETHGKLPRTWISTSRQGTRSGIRWFRIQHPGPLPGKLVHPDDPDISGVEIIQHTHRYAIVWPSIHPEGGQYRWVNPAGQNSDTIPRPADLPQLPQAWLDHINQDCSCWAPFNWDRHKTQPNDPVETAYRKWSGRMTETYGRHDAALGGVMALVAFKDRGWPGAQHYLDQLQTDFYQSLGDTRSQPEAQAEWERMIDGAAKKAPTSQIPIWQPHQTSNPPTPETFDARVEEELDKLRVRDKARRRFAAEQRPPAIPPEILTLTERLARPRPDIKWRIHGWQPAGTRSLLAAQYKAGKTTLVGNLIRSLVDNEPWLGTANVDPIITGRFTLLDFEMSERQLDDWLADQNIQNTDKVVVVPLRGKATTFDILDEPTRSQWADMLRGTEYLAVDCLRPILDALGLDEHREAGRFLTAFDALCDEAQIPDGIMVHHMGHHGERSRGDSRLRDWPDVEWRLVRENDEPNSPRYISAYGRDVEQPEGLLHHDPDSRHLSLIGGSRATAAARAALPDIIDYVSEHGPISKNQVEQEIKAATDHTLHPIREAIKLGILNGQIHKETGKRGAHILTIPPSSSNLVKPRHDEVPHTSSARYRADEVENDLCTICDTPGDLIQLHGETIHPNCAPSDWNTDPEDIAR